MRLIMMFCLAFLALPARAEITVFAAASLRGALDEVNAAFEASGQEHVTVSYASSAALARQIAQGAPAQVFLSANPEWVAYLAEDPYVALKERFDVLGNRLVLIGSDTAAKANVENLAQHLKGRDLAMGLVDAVPAGVYAKEALETLGLWGVLAPHVVQTDNVRAALTLVHLGEVQYGIVYLTDAHSIGDIQILDDIPDDSHSPIRYVAAQIGEGDLAARYLAFLRTAVAQSIFADHGFLPVTGGQDG